MSSTSHHHLLLALVVLYSSSSSPFVSAFGGIFSRAGEDVQLTRSSSIFGFKNTNKVNVGRVIKRQARNNQNKKDATLHVQIDYQTTTTDQLEGGETSFGWILPLPTEPKKVHLGSALLFQALDNQTQPTYDMEWLDTIVAGALPTDHLDFNTNLSYCTQDMFEEQTRSCTTRKPNITGSLFGSLGNDLSAMSSPTAAPSEPYRTQDVASYLDYELLHTADEVLDWLESHDYVLPHYLDGNHTEENDWWLLEAQWKDLLQDYVQDGVVFMALQLDHLNTNRTGGKSQPILIQYEIEESNPDVEIHRLPLEMSALTASSDATFDSYWMSDKHSNDRAVPINYLDLQLDDDYIDWMSCRDYAFGTESSSSSAPDAVPLWQKEKKIAECFHKDLVNRLHQAGKEVHPQSLITEYAGSLHDVYNPLSVPEGLTIILASSTSWLGFFHKLKANHIPAIPLVLEIIDRYVPPSSFAAPVWSKGGDNTAWLTVEACHQLNHLYEAPQEPTLLGPGDGLSSNTNPTPTLQECFDYYQPPTPDWEFNAQALAAELDNRVFKPYRRAQVWMRHLQSLTRLFGRLDAATAGGGEDPYLRFTTSASAPTGPPKHHSAKAAAVCDNGQPFGVEFTTSNNRVWELAHYKACDGGRPNPNPDWEVSAQKNHLILDLQDGHPTNSSTVKSVSGFVGDAIQRDAETGQFDIEAVEGIVTAGEKLLSDVLSGNAPPTFATEGSGGTENHYNRPIISNQVNNPDLGGGFGGTGLEGGSTRLRSSATTAASNIWFLGASSSLLAFLVMVAVQI